MKRRLLVLFAIVLLGACTSRGYEVKPVVSAKDHRKTEVPHLSDSKAIQKQDCFEIKIWAGGWDSDTKKVGIACIVKDKS